MSCPCLAAGLAAAALGGMPLVGVWSTTISGAPSPQFDGSWKLGFSSGGGYVISKGGQKLVRQGDLPRRDREVPRPGRPCLLYRREGGRLVPVDAHG